MTPYEKERIESARRRIGEAMFNLLDMKVIQAHADCTTARDILIELLEEKS